MWRKPWPSVDPTADPTAHLWGEGVRLDLTFQTDDGPLPPGWDAGPAPVGVDLTGPPEADADADAGGEVGWDDPWGGDAAYPDATSYYQHLFADATALHNPQIDDPGDPSVFYPHLPGYVTSLDGKSCDELKSDELGHEIASARATLMGKTEVALHQAQAAAEARRVYCDRCQSDPEYEARCEARPLS